MFIFVLFYIPKSGIRLSGSTLASLRKVFSVIWQCVTGGDGGFLAGLLFSV